MGSDWGRTRRVRPNRAAPSGQDSHLTVGDPYDDGPSGERAEVDTDDHLSRRRPVEHLLNRSR
jgi:hypothetical protein